MDDLYLIERVQAHVTRQPDRTALAWFNAKGVEERSLSFAELDAAARRLACALLNEGVRRGDTAVLCYTPGVDFYVAFWACLCAGITAVPVSPPLSSADVKRFLTIYTQSGARVVLTDRFYTRLFTMKTRKHKAARLGQNIASIFKDTSDKPPEVTFGDLEPLWWITTSAMSDQGHTVPLTPAAPHETAFIMYSSGSTAAPKGALTSLGNLRHQFHVIEAACGASPDHVSCWWAPHFHDFGLISGFLNSLHQGCKSVITSPMFFIQRPALWLEMMDRAGATHTFGPDFGYLLMLRKTRPEDREGGKWDLSRLKVAMSAAEKVRYRTLVDFAEAFAPCGFEFKAFCPAYGLAEHSVGVTINSHEVEPQIIQLDRHALEHEGRAVTIADAEACDAQRLKSLVGSGTPWHQTEVRIVELDPEGVPVRVCGPGEVGEIWVSSESKTLGYHKMLELTEAVFRARLPGVAIDSAEGKHAFLRTGDLGFIDAESGELFVCGRDKDMLIIAGKNHYSEDIELTIAEHLQATLRPGCIAAVAYEDEAGEQERLAIVAETKGTDFDRDACFREIQACVARAHHVVTSRILLVASRTIAKTSSGKIRRFVVREQMLADTLTTIPDGRWRPSHDETSELPSESAPSVPPGTRDSDFPRLLLDFRDFVTERGTPAAFPVYFPECGRGFEHWFFLTGTENLALMFDEERFTRMPVWNFTAPNPVIFNESNFPRWANGGTHREMKARLATIIDDLVPHTIERSTRVAGRYLERWAEQEEFPWLPEFNSFTTDLFCEVFTGEAIPDATDLFTAVLYGVDPFRKQSFEKQEVTRQDNTEEGLRAKKTLCDHVTENRGGEGSQFDADLLVGAGGFAVIPALKNVLINLYAQLSSKPAIRQAVLAELRSLPAPLTQEALDGQTPYLQACIYETIRLFPPVGHYYAQAKHDMTIQGLHVPKGANVVGHTWASYRDPALFRNPDIFDPARFLPPRDEHLSRPHAFEPFGTGDPLQGHACPGQGLALLLVKSVMAKSLVDYDWELEKPAWDDTRFRERYGVPNFEDGMQVRRFRERAPHELGALFEGQAAAREFTREELRDYAVAHPDTPLYLALLGDVFDVSDGAAFYGPGGPYSLFPGHDVSRAFAIMSIEQEDLDDPSIEGITAEQRQSAEQWHARLSAKYPVVGVLVDTKRKTRRRPRPAKLEPPLSWRVGVVGGGVSGLSAALALSEYGYEVSVFEKARDLGGHACAKPAGAHMRQPAFGVFMEDQWPNCFALQRALGLTPQVECAADDAIVHFARDGHNIPMASIEPEVERFHGDMGRALNDPDADGVSIGEFLEREGYSQRFIAYHFLGRAIHFFAGHSIAHYLDYPLRLIAWMYLGVGSVATETVYRPDNPTYIAALTARLQRRGVQLYRNTEVSFSERGRGRSVLSYQGGTRAFGQVVLAVQPRHALAVLGEHATEEETALLSQFESTVGDTVLHFDESYAPADRGDWGMLNFLLPDAGEDLPEPQDTVPITTCFPSTEDPNVRIFCTYDYAHADAWDGDGPAWKYSFEHAKVTPRTQALRRDLKPLQGKEGVHFCGSWSRGLTLHEDAVVTGLQAANRITGPDRLYPIARAVLPLPEPFSSSADEMGSTHAQVIENINAIAGEFVNLDQPLGAETELQGLRLSSLDMARLVNVFNSRLTSGTVSVEELYGVDTVGELAQRILDLGDSAHHWDALARAPELTARASGGSADAVTGTLHPVSWSQEQILRNHFAGDQRSSHWNIPLRTWLHGPLDTASLHEAFRLLATRQAVLRTRFQVLEGGELSQRIDAEVRDDFWAVREAVSQEAAAAMSMEIASEPLDVTRQVFRAEVITVDATRALLTIVLHHAVADGWSLGVLVRDLWAIYDALREASTEAKPTPAPGTRPRSGARVRQGTRFDFKTKLKAKCASWPQVVELFTHDISKGGIFLPTTADVIDGESIDFEINLPDGSEMSLTGTAVRVDTKDSDGVQTRGIGVQIHFPDAASEARCGALVDMARRGYNASPLMHLDKLPLHCVDVAYWQRDFDTHASFDANKAYWRRTLQAPLPLLNIAHKRQGAKESDASRFLFHVDAQTVEALRALGRRHQTSMNVILLTAYAAVLSRASETQGMVVQVPVAGRTPETEPLIGCLADALLLRVDTTEGRGFSRWVQDAHRQLYDGLKHSVPLALLLQHVDMRPADKLKLPRAVLHWEQTLSLRHTGDLPKGGLQTAPFVTPEDAPVQIAPQSQSVLNLNEDEEGRLHGEWLFARAAVSEEVMGRLVDRFQAFIADLASSDPPRADAPPVPTAAPDPVAPAASPIAPFAASTLFGKPP